MKQYTKVDNISNKKYDEKDKNFSEELANSTLEFVTDKYMVAHNFVVSL